MNSRAAQVLLALLLLAGLPACRRKEVAPRSDPLRNAYGAEPDWNNPERLIPLNYEQEQGKRLFYQYCVWCHADSTPAGPSNRSNLTPVPPLMNDGATLNAESDRYLENIIALGGSAVGKSAMMPPYSRTLTTEQIQSLIAFLRAIAQPPYQAPALPGPGFREK